MNFSRLSTGMGRVCYDCVFFIFGWTNPFICKMSLKKRHRDLLSPSVYKVWLKSPAALFCSTHLLCCVNRCDSSTLHVLPICFSYGTLSKSPPPPPHKLLQSHTPSNILSVSEWQTYHTTASAFSFSSAPLSNASLDLIMTALSGSPNTSQRLAEYLLPAPLEIHTVMFSPWLLIYIIVVLLILQMHFVRTVLVFLAENISDLY